MSISNISIFRFQNQAIQAIQDAIAQEEPLEISLVTTENGEKIEKKVSITMRTPGLDKELAIGFLFTEGILKKREDILTVESGQENKIKVILQPETSLSLQKLERNFYTTSSCGVCGKASIEAIHTLTGEKTENQEEIKISPELICSLPPKLREQQAVFESTGGLHASALFDLKGNFLHLAEDVGRHNALDKLIGHFLLENQPELSQHILLLSGRASFELIQKAAMAKISIVCAIGAPSSLAISLAQEQKITLIGFLKPQSFNIYSEQQRLLGINE